MKTYKVFCDACGKDITDVTERYVLKLIPFDDDYDDAYDVCDSCRLRFESWIEQKGD